MNTPRTLAVVGASLAGAKAAESARESGYDGRIVVVGDETALPYERPALSKAVLRGEAEPDTTRVHPDGFYDEHDIELVTDTVTAVDALRRQVELAGGESLGFDTAVIATGAAPRRLDSARRRARWRPCPPHDRRRCPPQGCHPGRDQGGRRGRWMDRLGGGGVGPPDGRRGRARRSGARPAASGAR